MATNARQIAHPRVKASAVHHLVAQAARAGLQIQSAAFNADIRLPLHFAERDYPPANSCVSLQKFDRDLRRGRGPDGTRSRR